MSADVRPKVVILNDTSARHHHGCSRVMRLLVAGLERQGLQITARSLAKHDWAGDPAFLAALAQSDLIVINGEGTLHHGRPAGAKLLAVVDHPQAAGRPVAVINALYQDNPADWGAALSRCALLAARDTLSADEMRKVCGAAPVRVVPDLSLSAGAETGSGPRSELVAGDAVRFSARRALASAALRLKAERYLPTKTLASPVFRMGLARWLLFCLYNGTLALRPPRVTLAPTEAAYLAHLFRAKGHLTGRFHAVCLSLVTGTPFRATLSNSWKIEALLDEAGLGRDRMISAEALPDTSADDLCRPFSADEMRAIDGFLSSARTKAETLFADLAKLARGGV